MSSTRTTLTVGVIRAGVIALTLATAWIHFTLGGLLFLLNATGYAAFALAMIAPIPLAQRLRPLTRIGLIGFAAATLAGWVLFGARFPLAYLDKGIELALIGLLVVEMQRFAEGPLWLLRQARLTLNHLFARRAIHG